MRRYALFFMASLSVPFWFFWTYLGIGKDYFDFMPKQFHYIHFWDCVGIAICISIIKSIVTPKLVSIETKDR